MNIDGYRALLDQSIAKRDALTTLIDALQVLIGDTPAPTPAPAPASALPPPMGARSPQPRRKAASRPPASKPTTPTAAADVVEARDAAIRTALKRNDGLATSKLLRAAMPKEPSMNDEQRDDAFRNTMTRLKRKGEIDRTGDTWSLVGLGSER